MSIILVNDGAKAITATGIYRVSDTTTIDSPWTTEEAGELLKLTWSDLSFIINWWEAHIELAMTGGVFLQKLITLSLSYQKSQMSREDFIKGMLQFNVK